MSLQVCSCDMTNSSWPAGHATRWRALAREVGGAWDARSIHELPPRRTDASVMGMLLLFKNRLFVTRRSVQVQHARRLFLLPSRGATSTATGEETRSGKRAGVARRTCGWFLPSHSSRMSRSEVLLFFSSIAGRGPYLAPSLWSSLGAEQALASVHRDG